MLVKKMGGGYCNRHFSDYNSSGKWTFNCNLCDKLYSIAFCRCGYFDFHSSYSNKIFEYFFRQVKTQFFLHHQDSLHYIQKNRLDWILG